MITSFISTTNVQKVSANVSKSISSENVEPSKDVVFDDRPPNIKPNPDKRFHSCLSSDSDDSLCIENELETIKTTLDKVVKRDDIENIVSLSIMGKLVINLKKEIKQEIMIEVGKETTKMRKEYNEKIVNMGGRIDVLEFDNANLLERNAALHTELKSLKENIKEIGNRSTDAMRQENWNEQYSRKKNVKIYNMPENRDEKLPVTLINQLKEKLNLNIDCSDIVAMQ
jgi:predicted RNase H-like nuclease (RuvC/YqgF family)